MRLQGKGWRQLNPFGKSIFCFLMIWLLLVGIGLVAPRHSLSALSHPDPSEFLAWVAVASGILCLPLALIAWKRSGSEEPWMKSFVRFLVLVNAFMVLQFGIFAVAQADRMESWRPDTLMLLGPIMIIALNGVGTRAKGMIQP